MLPAALARRLEATGEKLQIEDFSKVVKMAPTQLLKSCQNGSNPTLPSRWGILNPGRDPAYALESHLPRVIYHQVYNVKG